MPPMPFWSWEKVEITFPPELEGITTKIRFFFDTYDPWGNWFEGWYIDDVVVTGSGFGGLLLR